MTNWQELAAEYFMNTVERVPVTLVKGEGCYVWDDKGKKYLDFVAGWAVNSLGHSHPVLARAIARQARTLIQVSNQFYSVPQIQLAELLVKNSCLQKVFLCNSGAEANEGAIKLARRYGARHLNGAYEVISVTGSFHGRTLAMVAASGQAKYQQPYLPLPTGFINVDFNDFNAIKSATGEKTCAVMLEPVQGEAGVKIPDKAYLKAVRDWCTEKGILMILDEVQTGIGRLGTLFGYEQFGIEPDVMTLAKGLGGGVPIGAIMAKEKAAVFVPGEHGSTFGGNPLTCAAAYATLKYILDNDVVGHVKTVGKHLLDGLGKLKRKYAFVTDVRGLGLLSAIEFKEEIGKAVLMACLENGLLVNRVRPNALRFMPSLIVSREEIDEALGILDRVLANFA
jgi:predicted acetylornithine/succinylornithine family transaminase